MNLKERADLVNSVGSALSRGEHTLTVLPGLLHQLLEEGAWKEFETKMGRHVTHKRFEDFVTTPPLAGLGASIDLVKRIVKDDPATVILLNEVLKRPEGNPTGANQYQGGTVDIINSSSRPTGTSQAYALQKLSDEGEIELLDQVKAGKLSSHAAMKKAGLRPPKISVRLDNPESAAKTLLTHASPAFLNELRRLLEK